jgi:hypothetical protein
VVRNEMSSAEDNFHPGFSPESSLMFVVTGRSSGSRCISVYLPAGLVAVVLS